MKSSVDPFDSEKKHTPIFEPQVEIQLSTSLLVSRLNIHGVSKRTIKLCMEGIVNEIFSYGNLKDKVRGEVSRKQIFAWMKVARKEWLDYLTSDVCHNFMETFLTSVESQARENLRVNEAIAYMRQQEIRGKAELKKQNFNDVAINELENEANKRTNQLDTTKPYLEKGIELLHLADKHFLALSAGSMLIISGMLAQEHLRSLRLGENYKPFLKKDQIYADTKGIFLPMYIVVLAILKTAIHLIDRRAMLNTQMEMSGVIDGRIEVIQDKLSSKKQKKEKAALQSEDGITDKDLQDLEVAKEAFNKTYKEYAKQIALFKKIFESMNANYTQLKQKDQGIEGHKVPKALTFFYDNVDAPNHPHTLQKSVVQCDEASKGNIELIKKYRNDLEAQMSGFMNELNKTIKLNEIYAEKVKKQGPTKLSDEEEKPTVTTKKQKLKQKQKEQREKQAIKQQQKTEKEVVTKKVAVTPPVEEKDKTPKSKLKLSPVVTKEEQERLEKNKLRQARALSMADRFLSIYEKFKGEAKSIPGRDVEAVSAYLTLLLQQMAVSLPLNKYCRNVTYYDMDTILNTEMHGLFDLWSALMYYTSVITQTPLKEKQPALIEKMTAKRFTIHGQEGMEQFVQAHAVKEVDKLSDFIASGKIESCKSLTDDEKNFLSSGLIKQRIGHGLTAGVFTTGRHSGLFRISKNTYKSAIVHRHPEAAYEKKDVQVSQIPSSPAATGAPKQTHTPTPVSMAHNENGRPLSPVSIRQGLFALNPRAMPFEPSSTPTATASQSSSSSNPATTADATASTSSASSLPRRRGMLKLNAVDFEAATLGTKRRGGA